MKCQSCGKELTSGAMYCDECMARNLQAAIHPAGEAPTYVPPAAPSGPAFVPQSFPGQQIRAPRSPVMSVGMGIVLFALVVVVLCAGYVAYKVAHAPSGAVVAVPNNATGK